MIPTNITANDYLSTQAISYHYGVYPKGHFRTRRL